MRPAWLKSSKLAIYAAIAANVAIAVTKLVVAGITGSSAMLSEGIHFSVDTETADAALAMAEVERRVRERFPMIKRLFIESGSAAAAQRWSRPDALRTPSEAMATPN